MNNDSLVKITFCTISVIPACAGMTKQGTFYETINNEKLIKLSFICTKTMSKRQ